VYAIDNLKYKIDPDNFTLILPCQKDSNTSHGAIIVQTLSDQYLSLIVWIQCLQWSVDDIVLLMRLSLWLKFGLNSIFTSLVSITCSTSMLQRKKMCQLIEYCTRRYWWDT